MEGELSDDGDRRPLVWALTTGRVGDDAQVMLAANAVGGIVRQVNLKFNRLRKIPNRFMGATMRAVKNTPDLSGPWPDLVVGAGCRTVPPALWIRKQSGGSARLLRIGRPRAPLHWFDLVLTTPQYGLPSADNVMVISLPFAETPDHEAGVGGSVFAVLGGDSRTSRVTPEFAIQFGRKAMQMATEMGANLRICTSPRTPARAAAALVKMLPDGVETHIWRPDQPGPYRDWLNTAQACLTSGDSVSNISDAILTGRSATVLIPPAVSWLAAVEHIGGVALKHRILKNGNRSFLAPPPDTGALISHMLDIGWALRSDENTVTFEGSAEKLRLEHNRAICRIMSLARGC